jgi:hypothetical protein
MFSALINRAAPECVFISVMNNHTQTISTGHAAVWNYAASTANTTDWYVTGGSGYGVTMPPVTAASWNCNPALFAGVVAGRDIPPGDWGSVQVYGEHPGVFVTATTSAPFNGTLATVAFTNAVLTTLIMRPCGVYNSGFSGTTLAPMGFQSLSTTVATDGTADLHPFWPGGYAIPLGYIYNYAGTTSQTLTTSTSTGRVKAFIRALA